MMKDICLVCLVEKSIEMGPIKKLRL